MLSFFLMGDFYELLFDGPRKASRLLDITLTQRDQSATQPVVMGCVPVYLAGTPCPSRCRRLARGASSEHPAFTGASDK